ncbi:hypothetical protein PpBr36_03269 [Pyricularia pennisetigena]|uniref:hypothetical protein n=1 Tax=Pyricularia pennisetigena TaxID=1578925 RepID=UPI00115088C3|nr:hypothetical protein PpBr36_03269 [Pyricularia pennisetigena]TLS31051.1 hypothetical protein PpBr36_03269 [Pyricularia pennisetigena]
MTSTETRENISTNENGEFEVTETATANGTKRDEPSPLAKAPAVLMPNEHTAILYLYLTFDTSLPVVNNNPEREDQPPPPPQPDLSRFRNPIYWPQHRKNVMLALSCIATFLAAYTAGSYSPPARTMAMDLDNGTASHLGVLAGISTFCLGFALAPMALAPVSEINGRYPVFIVANVVFTAFQAACGAVKSLAGMLLCRFGTGVGGSVFSSMVGGVIADLWDAEGRNTPMTLFSCAVLLGTGIGPMVGASSFFTMEGKGMWRWVFYHQAIASAVLMIVFAICFKESRGPVLLSRKAKALNKWYEDMEANGYYGTWVGDEFLHQTSSVSVGGSGSESTTIAGTPDLTPQDADSYDEEKGDPLRRNSSTSTPVTLRRIRWRTKSDEERTSIVKMMSVSVSRPFHLLFTEPVVFWFALWVSFAWAVLYLTFGCIPLVFTTIYGWSVDASGRVFVAMCVGSILATAVSIYQERLLYHPKWNADSDVDPATLSQWWLFLRRRFPTNVPESRLYFTCITAALLPIGLFAFGLLSRADLHWIGPVASIAVATVGILSVYLASFNYLADVYQEYASSAIASQSCCRNLMGGAFPLVTGLLFRNLGPANAGVLLGCIAAALTLVPWILVAYGERIRARSRFAMSLDKI